MLIMFNFKILFRSIPVLLFLIPFTVSSQSLSGVRFSTLYGLNTDSLTLSDNTGLLIKREKPVLSFLLDEKIQSAAQAQVSTEDDGYYMQFGNTVSLRVNKPVSGPRGWR